jgi:opacity protein-like surface antigen
MVLAKEGFYMGLGVPYNRIETGGVLLSDVEEIDSAQGFSIFGGYEFTPRLALELGYMKSDHNAKELGRSIDVKVRVHTLSVKGSFMPYHSIQPYLLGNLSYGRVVIELADGSEEIDISSLDVGVGLDYYFLSNVSAGARLTAAYNLCFVQCAEFVEVSSLMLNVAYHF